MVLLCYEKNMSIDRHHILKTSVKKNDKLDILILTNANVFKETNTDSIVEDFEDWKIPEEKPKPAKGGQKK